MLSQNSAIKTTPTSIAIESLPFHMHEKWSKISANHVIKYGVHQICSIGEEVAFFRQGSRNVLKALMIRSGRGETLSDE